MIYESLFMRHTEGPIYRLLYVSYISG